MTAATLSCDTASTSLRPLALAEHCFTACHLFTAYASTSRVPAAMGSTAGLSARDTR